MTCPQCHKHIPAKAVWTASGLSGLTCPGCHASLSATPISAIIVFALSFGLPMRRWCFCGIGVQSFCWRLRDSSRCSRWCSRWQRP